MSSFRARLKEAMGHRGYESCMRRSVQSVILFEANRCISGNVAALRPFQRKLAFFDQATTLLDSLELLPHQKQEIMWRTATSKEALQPESAWKRMKLVEKELESIIEKVQPICEPGCSHEEICDKFIQQQYEAISGNKGKKHPYNWYHTHNNVIMVFKMYCRGASLDPDFPSPEPQKNIVVPAEKPKNGSQTYYISMTATQNPVQAVDDAAAATRAAMANGKPAPGAVVTAPPPPPPAAAATTMQSPPQQQLPPVLPPMLPPGLHPALQGPPAFSIPAMQQVANTNSDKVEENEVDLTSNTEANETNDDSAERRMLLKEVREHLDILKEFEGVITQEELNRRKRDLFLALPSAPPLSRSGNVAKRQRLSDAPVV